MSKEELEFIEALKSKLPYLSETEIEIALRDFHGEYNIDSCIEHLIYGD